MAFTHNHTRKVVLITGASDGLGLAAAKKYAQAGFTTVLAGRSKEKLAKAVEAVRVAANIKESQADQKVFSLCFDLSDLDTVRRGAAEFLNFNLPLNVLINNAGIFTTARDFTKDSNVFEKTIMVNMVAPLLFTELLITRMKESGGGKILIVSSNMHHPEQAAPLAKTKDAKRLILPLDNLDGSKAWDGQDFYAASKLADIWWAYVLADKLSNSEPRITVNAFCPGPVPATSLAREYPWILRKMAPLIFPLFLSNVLTPEKSAEQYLAYGTDPKFALDNGLYYQRGEKDKSSDESHDMVKAKTVYNLACQASGLEDHQVAV
ncbi:hypothetical protein BC943DRAFT_333013 [Umbelopsis sp. AD052]|nr:hypothetical protein BC943DRAFT_333013 [Umbelopsis sp. AD052]